MTRFKVNSTLSYEVISGKGVLGLAGELTAQARGVSKIMIVTDSEVAPIYLNTVIESYKSRDFDTESFIFPAGECSKTADTYLKIIEALADAKLTRCDAVAALGGGVVGDIAGFAAATYLRGIDVIQLPTTLLSAVDSSIGGKTGVNLCQGKNLLGAFHSPRLVLFDFDTLSTLNEREIKNGLGECVKYAVLGGGEVIEALRGGASERLTDLCQKIKIDIVEKDEKESGARKLLNLGHTVGHAIEKLSDFRISHGAAVAYGIEYMAAAAYAAKELDANDYSDICRLADMCKSGENAKFTYAQMREYIGHDKKLKCGGNISVAVIKGIGNCEVVDMTLSDFGKYIEAAQKVMDRADGKA